MNYVGKKIVERSLKVQRQHELCEASPGVDPLQPHWSPVVYLNSSAVVDRQSTSMAGRHCTAWGGSCSRRSPRRIHHRPQCPWRRAQPLPSGRSAALRRRSARSGCGGRGRRHRHVAEGPATSRRPLRRQCGHVSRWLADKRSPFSPPPRLANPLGSLDQPLSRAR